jgi:hypothetical protein
MYFLLGENMGRGPGWLERAILDLLRPHGLIPSANSRSADRQKQGPHCFPGPGFILCG